MDIKYYHCSICDFIFKDPKAYITAEKEHHIYNQHNNSIKDPRYVKYFRSFIENAILKQTLKGNKGLDFGSGPSPVLATLLARDYNFDMDIYDLFYSPEKVYIGRKYDLITSTEVIEHLNDPIVYFELFRLMMKKDSILAVMTQFHPQNSDKFLKWHYIRDASHISFYSEVTMRKIADILELEIIYMDAYKNTVFRLK